MVNTQAEDITRYKANGTLSQYDRGVACSSEQFNIKGEQWKSAYLPVWLYSYQEVKNNQKILHYVAVNARTKETMGSVPIHMPKLILVSVLVEILGFLAMWFVDWDYSYLFFLAGIIYFIVIYMRYRNADARHTYEKDTKTDMANLQKVDNFIQSKKGLSNASMNGANNNRVNGQSASNKIFNSFSAQNLGNSVVNSVTNSSPVAIFIKDNIDKKGGQQ